MARKPNQETEEYPSSLELFAQLIWDSIIQPLTRTDGDASDTQKDTWTDTSSPSSHLPR